MEQEPRSLDYPDGVADVDTPARRDRRLAIALVCVALATLVAAILWFTRSPGPPTAPVGLEATAETCGNPCELIAPRITIEWTPPEAGADVTAYRIVRDGVTLDATVAPTELSFVDDDVTIGDSYDYQVFAASDEGDSPPPPVVTATVPSPPDDAARLDGVYEVELTVRSATSIGAAFGIENPLPGKRGSDRWFFESTCDETQVECPSTWSGLEGDIEPRGDRWKGTVDGLPARCGRNGRAPAPIEIDLQAVDIDAVGGGWTVTGFRGTAQVSFRCPGFPAASAVIEVTGTL
ncbi:hypothetical protein BH18ACT17_BH18ACT17_10070 [soil metagenome]